MTTLADAVDAVIRELFGQTLELAPFEPDERVIWAVRSGLKVALGDDAWKTIDSAMPRVSDLDDRLKFQAGTVLGVGDAVVGFLNDQVSMMAGAIRGMLAYYSLVYDINVWKEMLAVWTAPPGTSVQPFAQFLKTDYPALYAAVIEYRPTVKKLDDMVKPLLDGTKPAASPWSVRETRTGEWMVSAALWLGGALKPVVDELVAAKGDPFGQGRIAGRVTARVIIEAALLALGLYDLVAAGLRAAGTVVSDTRAILSLAEQTRTLVVAEKSAAGVTAGAKAVAQTKNAAVVLYEELATDIQAYSKLRVKTGAFNSEVRELVGCSLTDVEYVKVRLDANHIVKGEMYDAHAADFERFFGWTKADDMDAMAMHTEWHIRSGEKLKTKLNLLGAENEKSFSHALDTHIDTWQKTHGPFQSLEQVFVAHEEFYKAYSPRLYEKLKPWFAQKLAVIRAG